MLDPLVGVKQFSSSPGNGLQRTFVNALAEPGHLIEGPPLIIEDVLDVWNLTFVAHFLHENAVANALGVVTLWVTTLSEFHELYQWLSKITRGTGSLQVFQCHGKRRVFLGEVKEELLRYSVQSVVVQPPLGLVLNRGALLGSEGLQAILEASKVSLWWHSWPWSQKLLKIEVDLHTVIEEVESMVEDLTWNVWLGWIGLEADVGQLSSSLVGRLEEVLERKVGSFWQRTHRKRTANLRKVSQFEI